MRCELCGCDYDACTCKVLEVLGMKPVCLDCRDPACEGYYVKGNITVQLVDFPNVVDLTEYRKKKKGSAA